MRIQTLHYDPLDVCLEARDRHSSGIAVVCAFGDVDEGSVDAFTGALDAGVHHTGHCVIVDLTHVGFLGLAGAQALAAAKLRADREGVHLLLVPGGRGVLRPLVVTGLLDRFARYDSVQSAVARVRAANTPQRAG